MAGNIREYWDNVNKIEAQLRLKFEGQRHIWMRTVPTGEEGDKPSLTQTDVRTAARLIVDKTHIPAQPAEINAYLNADAIKTAEIDAAEFKRNGKMNLPNFLWDRLAPPVVPEAKPEKASKS